MPARAGFTFERRRASRRKDIRGGGVDGIQTETTAPRFDAEEG